MMKTRLFTISFTLLLTAPTYSMEEFGNRNNNSIISDEQSKLASENQKNRAIAKLKEQIETVQQTIANQEVVNVVLGARGDDNGAKERFDGSYVFIDIGQSDDSRTLTLNFNDIPSLELVAQAFPDRFTTIVLDKDTYKFTHWTTQHLELFKQMLKPGGKFIFAPYMMATFSQERTNFNTPDDYLQCINKYAEDNTKKEKLLTSYPALNQLYPKTATDEQIEEIFLKVSPFLIRLKEAIQKQDQNELTTIYKEMANNGLPTINSRIIMDDNKVKEYIRRILNEKHFKEQLPQDIFAALIIPHNIIPLVHQVFGENNVSLQAEGILPFKSSEMRPDNTAKNIITAEKG